MSKGTKILCIILILAALIITAYVYRVELSEYFIGGEAAEKDSSGGSPNENIGTDNNGEGEQCYMTFDDIRRLEAGTIVNAEAMPEELIDSLFFREDIGDEVRGRIMGISYKENENISLPELDYIRVLHMGFDGNVHIGELIVNKEISGDILEIMRELYRNNYPIEKMVLVDEYGGDDEASMSDNNSSAFNYRVIANTSTLSNHARGMAVDINPRYNPYITADSAGNINIAPQNGAEYADRTKEFIGKIDEDDLCLKLFLQHGFSWGGNWEGIKDYQHFEKTIN